MLFLTQRDDEGDVVDALSAGADDFLVKPPRERELLARVEAVSRRGRESAATDEVMDIPPSASISPADWWSVTAWCSSSPGASSK